MKNEVLIRSFTENLCEMLESGLPLKESLLVLRNLKGGNFSLRKLCAEILYSLEGGKSFCEAVKECSLVEFPLWFTGFIALSGESVDLTEIFVFLKSRLDEKKSERESFVSNLIYPFFVSLAATGFALYLELNFHTGKFFRAMEFTIVALLFVLVLFKVFFSESEFLSFLKAMDFLYAKKVPLKRALELGKLCIPENKKLMSVVSQVENEILCGENIARTFEKNMSLFGFEKEGHILAINLQMLLSGSKRSPFLKTYRILERKVQRKKNCFLKMEQPFFLAVAATVILIATGDMSFLYGGF